MRINVSEIEGVLKKFKKKDPLLFRAARKKILQISQLKKGEIDYFKNLRVPLNQYKRVHIGSFVLLTNLSTTTKYTNKTKNSETKTSQ